MKRLSIILTLAVVNFLTACQKDNALQGTPDENAWQYDVTLPVPIQFGSSSPETKAMVGDSFTEDMDLGLFAVTNKSTSWAKKESDLSKDDFIWPGETGKVIKMSVRDDEVCFEKNQFYPLVSSNSYDFYGYYPYEDSGKTLKIEYTDDNKGLQIAYELPGNKDVLWAHAIGEERFNVKGFNASYIRAINNAGAFPEFQPKLFFTHRLAKINFSVKAGGKEDNKYVSVVGAKITGNYNKAKLLIASCGETKVSAGSFITTVDDEGEIDIWHVDGSGTESKTFGNIYPRQNPEPDPLGYAFIVPTPAYDEDASTQPSISVSLSLALDSDGKDSALLPEPVDEQESITLPYPKDGYLSGYEYNYTLVVYDAVKMEIAVELDGYKEYIKDYVDEDGKTWNKEPIGEEEELSNYLELAGETSYTYNATEGMFSLFADGSWTIESVDMDTSTAPTWLTELSSTTRTDDSEDSVDITFKLTVNDGAERRAKIIATSGSLTKELIITQKAAP